MTRLQFKNIIWAGSLAALSGLPATLNARDLVGTGFVEGKIVQLFDDGTWKYMVDPQEAGCKFAHEFIEICATEKRWKQYTGPIFEFDKMYVHDDRHFAGVIVENLGAIDGMSFEGMLSFVLSNVADAASVSVEEIPVHSISDGIVDNLESKLIVYGAKIDGLNIVYANSIVVQERMTLQALTWAVGSEFSEKHKDLHADFLSGIRIKYKAPVQ